MKNKLKKLPKFKSEKQERNFWQKHSPLDYFNMENSAPAIFPNLKPSTTPISIRFPNFVLAKLKMRANQLDVPYQSLIKHYVTQELEIV